MAKESGDMDPFSEKHPLSDDEGCKSPRTTDKKKVRRLSRQLMDVDIEKTGTLCEDQNSQSTSRAEILTNLPLPNETETLNPHFLQGARPKEHRVMYSEELQPTESPRFIHGARSKEYGSMRPKPLEPKGTKCGLWACKLGGDELAASYRHYLEQKACPTNKNYFEQVEQRLQRAVQSERKRDSCNLLTPAIDDPRRQDYDPHQKASSNDSGKSGVWKVEVARCLTQENCKLIASYKGFYAEISHKIGDANLGLEVLEFMEKKGLIGPDGQNLYNTLFELNLSAAVETLQRCVPKKFTPPPVHKDYTYEELVKDLQTDLDPVDAHQIATAFNFTANEIHQVKNKGTCDLLAKLLAKNIFGPKDVNVLGKMLERLKFLKAYRHVEKYEKQLQFPVVPVRLAHVTPNSTEMEQDPKQQQKDEYINKLFTELTITDNKEELTLIVDQLNEYLLSKDLKLVSLSKGSLILHLLVTSVATLNELVNSIDSGEFARDCSRILFPGKELETLGFGTEIRLTASYDIDIIERAKAELEKLDERFIEVHIDEKGETSDNYPLTDIQSISFDDDEDHNPVVPVRLAHVTPNSTEMEQDPKQQQKDEYINQLFTELTITDNKEELTLIVDQLNEYLLSKDLKLVSLSKGSLILHLRVTSVATLNELVNSINSGEFARDCSRILFPGKELETLGFGTEIQLTASYDIDIIERAKTELEKLEDAFIEVHLDEKSETSDNFPLTDIQSISGNDDEDYNPDCITVSSEEDISVPIPIHRPINSMTVTSEEGITSPLSTHCLINYSSNAVLILPKTGIWQISVVPGTFKSPLSISFDKVNGLGLLENESIFSCLYGNPLRPCDMHTCLRILNLFIYAKQKKFQKQDLAIGSDSCLPLEKHTNTNVSEAKKKEQDLATGRDSCEPPEKHTYTIVSEARKKSKVPAIRKEQTLEQSRNLTVVSIPTKIVRFKEIEQWHLEHKRIITLMKELRKSCNLFQEEQDEATSCGVARSQLSGKKELFIQCLKKEFLSWYETMTPVPWKKSCKWIAQDLFVGSGLILTDSKSNVDPPDVDPTCKLQYDDLSTHESLETEFRLTLEGEPGFGKTTLTSQLAYDWSQSKFSYTELLMFLPIKFVGELTLADTVKECYIPDHTPLTEKYLYEILERGNSETCIILDGPDEYNPKVTEEEGKPYEVHKVMSKNKYSTFKVIITARSDYAQDLPTWKMLRVRRFGETERNSLIEILFRSDEEKQKQMDRAIIASSFILEICSVPLFFERVIHNFESIDKYKDEKQDKVTRFMMSIVDALSKQICGNEESGNTRNSKNRSAVEELALTGPCRGSQNLSWQRDNFEEIIDNVKEGINAVIIIIKDDISVKVKGELEPEDRLVPSASVTAKVKFLHKLFQEWYAAWYLSEIWSSKKESFSDVLNSLDAIDLHYILRFTCYLCPPYCHPVLCHLMKKHRSTEGQKEPIMGCIYLCSAECNETKGHDIKLIVRDICKEAIVIQSQDRRLLQYAKTVVPKFASQSQVSSVSKEEEDGKIQVEDQTQRLFDKPSGCTLKNVFWFPCTEKLVRRTLSIRETVKDALITAFKNNFTDHGVHMVPHYLGIRRSIKLRQKGIARKTLDFPVCDKQIEDNQYLSENQKLEILRKRIADRTVYDAAVAISKWAGDLELDMFIFTNYKYSDYLKNVAIATDIDGKHDIVVISRDLGVIFIQVSSSMGKSRKVAKQQLQKKTQQLMKDKLVFLESNRDLSEVTSKIPLYQLAAFPNFRREFVLLDVCRGHSQSFLTKECFYSDNIFVTLNEKISIPSEPCLSEKDYQYLCSRYVGIASTDNTRTALDGIKTTFKILKKAFLTSEQRQILDMDDINSCIVLTGDCGTGKSLMLTQKALRFAKNENCKPILVSCADLQRFGGLQTTFGNDTRGHLSIQKEILDKLDPNIATFSIKYAEDQSAIQQSFIEMFVSMLRGFTQGMEKVHILLDELPFITVKENPSIFNSLLESIPAECHLWLSTTTVSSTEEELLKNLVSKQNCGPRRFKLFHLDKIMRMPETVVNLYSSIQEFIGGQSSNKAIGHVVMGPKPMLFSLDVCSCKELDEASLTCLCTKLRLIKALRNIMKVVGDIEHDRISFYIHSITRLQAMFELLSEVMKTLNFSLKWWFEKESNDTESFSVLTENAHWRCESAIVISVDPLGMNHWEDGVGDRAIHTSVFSRCLSQYIHLVWPKQEAAELFDVELNSLEEDFRLYYVNARIMKENAHCRNAKSEEGCLEYLKKADLFVAGPQ